MSSVLASSSDGRARLAWHLLQREQTGALLQLLAAHRSRVQIAPMPAAKEKSCD